MSKTVAIIIYEDYSKKDYAELIAANPDAETIRIYMPMKPLKLKGTFPFGVQLIARYDEKKKSK